ncbi:MAG: hypothetical protein F6K17_15175 [Okeania sp. SIO3C4]|nr:hypothetical protein [Okeania sp. SIO3C4]
MTLKQSLMNIKYIYTNKGQEEAVIVPIDFWQDILKHSELLFFLKQERYFQDKYSALISSIEKTKEEEEGVFSLFGAWDAEEAGDEINKRIYNERNDAPRDVTL